MVKAHGHGKQQSRIQDIMTAFWSTKEFKEAMVKSARVNSLTISDYIRMAVEEKMRKDALINRQ